MRVLLWSAVVGVLAVSPAAAQGPPATVRAEFLKTIDRPRVALDPSAVRTSGPDGRDVELLSIASEANERVPLLIIKSSRGLERRPALIALHGTNGAKESMRDLLERYADAGFVAVAMDARHAGERATAIPGLANAYQSALLRAFRTGKGQPYLYDTVWDVMRLVDYLSTRPDVDPVRIGVIGNSKGGTEAYLAAAADTRIAAVAPLIGVQSYGWSLTHAAAWEARTWTLRAAVEAAAADGKEAVNAGFMRKFYDRITPGLVDRFDGPAMLPLIAPRPLIVVNGDSDPRSALGGVRTAVAASERAYAAAGAPDKFQFLLQVDTAHETTPEAHEAVLKWFVRWLKP
jgi:dienelactone hydrolase